MTAKKMTVQTVRLSPEMQRAVLHRMADTGESFQGFMVRLIQRELSQGVNGMPDMSHLAHPVDSQHGLVTPISQEAITELVEAVRALIEQLGAGYPGSRKGRKRAGGE